MFDIYKLCVFFGLYCFIFGFGCFESYCHLKKDGVIVKGTYSLRKTAFALWISSAVLLAIGLGIYSTF